MKKTTAILFIAVMAMFISSLFGINPLAAFLGLAVVGTALSGNQFKGVFNMAISATIVDIRGKAYEPIIEELLFLNKTVEENLVNFETDVKAETIFTENTNTTILQPYTSGAPKAAGSMNTVDVAVTPAKVMFYDEFDPNTLRTSRFKRDMKAGAWNTASSEFERTVLQAYGANCSQTTEVRFWTGMTTATKAAIAALTPGVGQGAVGAAEQTWAAAQTVSDTIDGNSVNRTVDGVVTKMIYNNGALGTRIKVAGTTISSSNIAAEYAKVYAAIPALVLNGNVAPYIYAPYSHKQLINIFNISATYRDLFSVSKDYKTYYYNGVEIKFVPLPENCMIAARPDYIVWCTDLVSDLQYMEINKIANNRDDMFVKKVFTLAAHIVNQRYNVLYLG